MEMLREMKQMGNHRLYGERKKEERERERETMRLSTENTALLTNQGPDRPPGPNII